MSVRKLFVNASRNWFKILKLWTNHIQGRYYKRHFHSSTYSISTFGRASISTEVTILDYDSPSSSCQNSLEIDENILNENIEKLTWKY
ncbi:hypothetical protein GWI33_002828 [Rhynchophorus ferrugineus]|uniref:Uncharacterized protein n=1 Tax=Rhynchophorus ferrugineus TaxID=354439 RepID=A0A834IVR2_RHYFE|nr:hypothetical protein GWI33_002828 [Rhynchophorus ferrugineus]